MTATQTAPARRRGPAGWSLSRRVAAAVVTVALVTGGVAAVLTVLLLQVRTEQQRVVRHYFSAITASDNLFLHLVDDETAVRGYALTGNTTMLDPLTQAPLAADVKQIDQLRVLLADDPPILEALDRLDVSATTWYQTWAQPTIEEVRLGGPKAATAGLIDQGRALFGQVRTSYAAYLQALLDRREQALAALSLRTNLLFANGILAVATVLSGCLALWVALRRWVSGPIERLAAETQLVRSGELTHEVAGTGPPELRALGQDVEAMRRSIVSQLAQVEQARAEIELAERELRERAAELARSNQDLEQFAYVASHDLQEPLRKVASFCQLLQRRYSDQLDERAQTYISFAVDGALRMQRLINDLLAFSRVGRVATRIRQVELAEVLEAAKANLATAIEETGAVVSNDPLPEVRGDAGLLTQLFQNLLSNALKFHGAQPPRVHIGAELRGDVWELCCADNGIGIEPQYAQRIFVIFQRLHSRTDYAGTGIGLALVKKIVEWHGGEIWLDQSDPDRHGATFRWTIPVHGHPHPIGSRVAG